MAALGSRPGRVGGACRDGKTARSPRRSSGAPVPSCWHTCRARDADPGRLLLSIFEELRAVVPGATDTLLEQLHAPGDVVEPEAVVDALLWELTRLLLEPLVLVLDDGEQLSGDPTTLGRARGAARRRPVDAAARAVHAAASRAAARAPRRRRAG